MIFRSDDKEECRTVMSIARENNLHIKIISSEEAQKLLKMGYPAL